MDRLTLLVTAIWCAMCAVGCERGDREQAPARKIEVEDRLRAVRCRLDAGIVSCQGDNTFGVVREPAERRIIDEWTKVDLPGRASDVDLGEMSKFACAVVAGRVYCWGDATEGQLGTGETLDVAIRDGANARPKPQVVQGPEAVTSIGLGIVGACALTRDGAVWCWGGGHDGPSLGVTGDPPFSASALRVIEHGATAILVTGFQTCAIVSARVSCWGGYVPDATGAPTRARMPTEVPNTDGAVGLSADKVTICAERQGANKTCWNSLPDDAP